jgi:hypothetical protein
MIGSQWVPTPRHGDPISTSAPAAAAVMTDRRRGGGWLASSAPPRPRGHRDAYSLEDAGGFTRHNFNANVSDYMLTSTYWPAWKAAVQEGKAKGVMCSCEIIDYDHCVHTRLRGGGRWPWAIGHHKN